MNESIWTKRYTTILIAGMLMFVGMYITMSVLPYHVVSIGGDKSSVGLLTAAIAFPALIFRPVFGNLLQKGYLKSIIVFGSVLMTVSSVGHLLNPGITLLLVLRVLSGIALSAFTTGAGTMVSHLVPADKRGEGLGYYGFAMVATSAVGPVLGLNLYNARSFEVVAVLSLFIFAVSTAISMSIGKYTVKKMENAPVVLFEKSAIPSAMVLFFLAFAFGSLMSFIPLYALERNLTMVGFFFPIQVIGIMLARILSGRIFDKNGIGPIMLPAIASAIAACLMLAFGFSNLWMLGAGLLFGCGYGAVQPAINALMISICPPGKEGLANAAFYTTMDISVAIGAIVSGFLTKNIGFTQTFIFFGFMCMMSYMSYRFVLRRQLVVGLERGV